MAAKPENKCPDCDGTGLSDASGFGDYVVCPTCEGSGFAPLPYKSSTEAKCREYEQRIFGLPHKGQ